MSKNSHWSTPPKQQSQASIDGRTQPAPSSNTTWVLGRCWVCERRDGTDGSWRPANGGARAPFAPIASQPDESDRLAGCAGTRLLAALVHLSRPTYSPSCEKDAVRSKTEQFWLSEKLNSFGISLGDLNERFAWRGGRERNAARSTCSSRGEPRAIPLSALVMLVGMHFFSGHQLSVQRRQCAFSANLSTGRALSVSLPWKCVAGGEGDPVLLFIRIMRALWPEAFSVRQVGIIIHACDVPRNLRTL